MNKIKMGNNQNLFITFVNFLKFQIETRYQQISNDSKNRIGTFLLFFFSTVTKKMTESELQETETISIKTRKSKTIRIIKLNYFSQSLIH